MCLICFPCCQTQNDARKRLDHIKGLLSVRSDVDKNTLSLFSNGIIDVIAGPNANNELIACVFRPDDISEFVSIVHRIMEEKSLAPQSVIAVCKLFACVYPNEMSAAFRNEMAGSYHQNFFNLYVKLLAMLRGYFDFMFLIKRSNEDKLSDIFDVFLHTCEQNAADDSAIQTMAKIGPSLIAKLSTSSYNISTHLPEIIRAFALIPSIVADLPTEVICSLLCRASIDKLTEFVRIVSRIDQHPHHMPHLIECVIQVCLRSLAIPDEQIGFISQMLQDRKAPICFQKLLLLCSHMNPNNALHLAIAEHFLRLFYTCACENTIKPDQFVAQQALNTLNTEITCNNHKVKVAVILGILIRYLGRHPTGGTRGDIRVQWTYIFTNPHIVQIGVDEMLWKADLQATQHMQMF